ncbi:tyrosine-protein kinase family protein [Mucilaginibacter panaciglaebae]|uniref:Tyrosine-protein kinase G-rich domain-containing protein n=1 Tax=Mucilaginibacter panaciglaebae TaxID=502331 RepID=A0ABP7WJ36_9SPHI
MYTQRSTAQHVKGAQPDDEYYWREIFVKYLNYWPVFLLFILIAMIGAYACHTVTRPVYDIKATLLLQDDSQTNDNRSSLQSMGIAGSPKSFGNDVEVLESRRLIAGVVSDLKLWVSYKVVENHLQKELYGAECPITFNLVRPSGKRDQNIIIVIKNAYSFTLKTSDEPDEESTGFGFNSDVNTSAGLWQIIPTANLNKYIGSTIIIQLTDPQTVVAASRNRLVVALKDQMESSAVEITYKDQIPRRGRDFVNHLINLFNKTQVNDKKVRTKTKLDFIDRRLDSLSSQLNYAQKQVEPPKSSHAVTNRQTQEALYNLLLQKREEVELDYASTLSNAQLIDVAYVIPLKPVKALVPFAAALLLGLLIPAGLIYLKEAIKDKITNRRSIEKALLIPISGELEEANLRTPIVTDDENDKVGFMLVEQFRSLRTQLHYLHNHENKGRVTLIASSVPGEGKSFVTSNLGVALATSGKRTIILELNLYKPVMARIFNLPELRPGMSNYLNWESLKEEVIQNSVTYRNLDIITSGQFITNFSELLDRKRIEILLDWLREHYDHILIDTSPLQVIGDANIVAHLCDITLYVIRKDFTPKSQLSFINNLCIEKQLPGMSIVLNGIDSVTAAYKDYFNTKG